MNSKHSDSSVMSDAPAIHFRSDFGTGTNSNGNEGKEEEEEEAYLNDLVAVGMAKIGLRSKAKVFITSDDDVPAIGFEKTQIR